jgi:hypothetical protein
MPAPHVDRAPKNWLFGLFATQRPDKRRFPRQSLPWAAAYFFTGGAPAPASVRDISLSGMFVNTSERWYLGTIIHMTLTDWRMPTRERSVTVNAMAVRWGDDGVGLRFIYQKPRRGEPPASDAPLVDVTPYQVGEFLRRFTPGT